MTDYSDTSPSHRLSNAERDAAVASLARSLADGRISTDEFTERSSKAKAAITGADLAPLFADLPPEAGPGAATPPPAQPYPPQAQYAQPPAQAPAYGVPGYTSHSDEGLGLRLARTIAPIVALILFFTFGTFGIAGGWATSWLWWVVLGVFYTILQVMQPSRRS
jgi:hypothetical protein